MILALRIHEKFHDGPEYCTCHVATAVALVLVIEEGTELVKADCLPVPVRSSLKV